ncbi:hypothetical protein K438DRAFT_1996250 [Mycena galopus ATCC 62051]|nr:hypothetical protein K438DRAFT_1996250 [Mycena galopus ATCC 62051]
MKQHEASFSSRWDKICVNCRRRRVKCDGARPKCGPCSRSLGFQDCEYADDGRATEAQILEEQIANVEARIQKLGKPGFPASLPLHNPYSDKRSSSSQRPHLASPSRSSTPFHNPTSTAAEIPPIKLEPLIRNFFRHSSQFGFFLNVHRFQEATSGRSGRPAPGLLDVIHLWAINLSGSDEFTAYEAKYLSRALTTVVNAMAGTHSSTTILYIIQAEVLLSYYFMRNTRFLEAKYHLSTAVSLVFSSGLHRIRSSEPCPVALAPPRDALEECERINGFWAVLTLDSCFAAADGSPSNISYTSTEARIDTPWPMDINSSDLNNQVLPHSSFGTVTAFLGNQPDNGTSISALHAKAAILFNQASHLASRYQPDMNNDSRFRAWFKSTDALIEKFKLSLPTVHSHSSREMIMIHCLAHVATIQSHNPFVLDNDASRSHVVTSARTIVTNLAQVPLDKFVHIDPVMGTLLMAACQVFVAELARFRRRRPLNSPVPPQEKLVMDTIETVLAAMNIFSPSCPIMNSQLSAMQQLYRGH